MTYNGNEVSGVKKEPKKTYTFQIPEELLERLNRMARWECRSTAGMLRVLIQAKVEEFEQEQK